MSNSPSRVPPDAAEGVAARQARRHSALHILRRASTTSGAAVARSEPQPDAASLIAFSDERVRRGVRFHRVLRCGARVLANSEGSADTFNLSQPTQLIHTFFSHNWAVPRHLKLMVLVVYFNLSISVAVAVVMLAVIVALSPGRQAPTFDCGDQYYQGFLAVGVAMPLFFLVLFLGHELRPRGPLVFLDKVCIHQTDAALKEHGIRSLGAFVCSSKNLLICYTDLYLQKLWTVYEIATFLVVSSSRSEGEHSRKAHLVPVSFASFVLLSSTVNFLSIATNHVLAFSGVNLVASSTIPLYLLLAILAVFARRWAKEFSRTQELIDEFSFERAHCFVEADRALVARNIVALMKHYKLVEEAATNEDGLQNFNEYVRRAVPRLLKSSVGRVGLPYQYIVPLAVISYAEAVDTIMPWQVYNTRWVLLNYLGAFTRCFGVFPISVAVMLWGTRRCMRFTCWAELALCAAVALCAAGLFVVLDPQDGPVVGSLVYDKAKMGATVGDDTMLGVLLVYHVVIAVVTFALYRPLPQDLLKLEAKTKAAAPETVGDDALDDAN